MTSTISCLRKAWITQRTCDFPMAWPANIIGPVYSRHSPVFWWYWGGKKYGLQILKPGSRISNLLSFHKLCIDVQVDVTTFERSPSLRLRHMITWFEIRKQNMQAYKVYCLRLSHKVIFIDPMLLISSPCISSVDSHRDDRKQFQFLISL